MRLYETGLYGLLKLSSSCLGYVELSESQQKLMSINRQYDRLGERLAGYQRELLSVQGNVTQFLDDFHQHLHWLDVIDTSVVPLSDFTGSSDEVKSKTQEQQVGQIIGLTFMEL